MLIVVMLIKKISVCDVSRPYLKKKRTRLRTPISGEAQVGSFLYCTLPTEIVIEKP